MPDTSQAGMKTRAPAPGCARRRCDSVLGSSRLWHRRARQLAAGGEERCCPCKGQSTTSGAATAPANSRLLKMATKFMPVNLGLNSLLQLKASIGVFLFVCLLFVFNSLFLGAVLPGLGMTQHKGSLASHLSLLQYSPGDGTTN